MVINAFIVIFTLFLVLVHVCVCVCYFVNIRQLYRTNSFTRLATWLVYRKKQGLFGVELGWDDVENTSLTGKKKKREMTG